MPFATLDRSDLLRLIGCSCTPRKWNPADEPFAAKHVARSKVLRTSGSYFSSPSVHSFCSVRYPFKDDGLTDRPGIWNTAAGAPKDS